MHPWPQILVLKKRKLNFMYHTKEPVINNGGGAAAAALGDIYQLLNIFFVPPQLQDLYFEDAPTFI
jgi:hypothetical protein